MLPFVTLDVLLVALLAAFPLGLLAAAQVVSWGHRGLAGLLAISAWILTGMLLLLCNTFPEQSQPAWPAGGLLIRGGLAGLCCFGLVLIIYAWSPARLQELLRLIHVQSTPGLLMAAFGVAFGVPAIHVEARCQHERTRFEELYGDSRLGEAHALLRDLLALQPQFRWQDRPGQTLLRELEQELQRVEQARQQIPNPPRHLEDILQQAQSLGILGQSELALAYLDQFPQIQDSAEGTQLRGLIHETRREWSQAISAYTRSQQLSQAVVDTDSIQKSTSEFSTETAAAPDATYLAALKGEAFCRRKAGDLPGAEQGYLRLMNLAPTAEHAFLLAQFYEDSQQTTQAHHWAQEAQKRDPAYAAAVLQLSNKLTTSHFGCWSVYRQHRSFQSPPFP